jgi:hypothetical protein
MAVGMDTFPDHMITPNKELLYDLALIIAIWVIGSIVVNPIGEFPLNDDWVFSRTVKSLLETGTYSPLSLASMSLITHVLWGVLFCLPAGFSFTALRISCVAAGLLGVLGAYFLVRDMRHPRWLALMISLTLAFFPGYYLNSHTFMTDIPFAALAIWSLVFFGRSLRTGSDIQTVIGTLFAIASVLSRQLALAIPLALVIPAISRSGFSPRSIFRAVVPLAVCVVVLLLYNHWLDVTHRTAVEYAQTMGKPWFHVENVESLLFGISLVIFFSAIHIGLFLFPMFLCCGRNFFLGDRIRTSWRDHRRGAACLTTLGILLLTTSACFLTIWEGIGLRLPMSYDKGNMLGLYGLGPFSLRDFMVLNLDGHLVAVPELFWIVITAIGFVGAALLIAKLSLHAADIVPRLLRRTLRIDGAEAVGAFLILCGLTYMLPFAMWGLYDRYFILLIPCLAGGMLSLSGKVSGLPREIGKVPLVVASMLLVCWALVSISGTRDYLTWNRVRWEALRDLMATAHVDATQIDGGPEFNGLYLYDPSYNSDPPGANSRSPWWVDRDTYQIGFDVVPRYTVIKEYTYKHWFPPHRQKIVVMRRDVVPTLSGRP